MSFASAAPFRSAMNGVVCCPTCGLAAIVEGKFRLQGTGPVGRLRISCIDGHGWLLLADRVKEISPWSDFDQMISQSDHHVEMTASEQVPLPADHGQADQAE
ncbi:MAG TPA: hypothetical protein VE645_14280 [Pseudonocardiaceae bacterium]|nr:hypothetical protein [Pseudonocardiaceae bacterium]